MKKNKADDITVGRSTCRQTWELPATTAYRAISANFFLPLSHAATLEFHCIDRTDMENI
jgi:hypothetical protein